MDILGLSAYYHDSAACLVRDGRIVAAAQEERFTTDPRWWALAIGGVLVFSGLVAPRLLSPVHRGWMALGHVMGWINTRIILSVFFCAILTPMALVARLVGKDFMRLKTPPGADTYRVPRTPRSATHVWHQF